MTDFSDDKIDYILCQTLAVIEKADPITQMKECVIVESIVADIALLLWYRNFQNFIYYYIKNALKKNQFFKQNNCVYVRVHNNRHYCRNNVATENHLENQNPVSFFKILKFH